MTTASESSNAPTAPFGTVFTDHMTVARWADGVWDVPKLGPVEPLPLHPATHALHYGSSCFEGLKAHRGVDGVVNIFRLDAHVRRLQQSADTLALPAPPEPMLRDMIIDVVRAGLADVPDAPGSLYLRPTLLGTEVNIGAAGHPSAEAILFVLASPVGDYFEGGMRP
ncbi:MAG: aminotransferase class IV, partial [Acidimicrobiia bacterium]